MSSAVVVIDVQNCFLPGGGLPTGNARNQVLPASTLAKSIGKFINAKNPDQIFITQDWHTPGHTSFAKNGETPMTSRKNAYTNDKFRTNFKRSWGTPAERKDQTLWPEHCVQDTDGAKLAPELETYLQDKSNVQYIYKGDEPEVDSYSAIANALGFPTPHIKGTNTSFLSVLETSDLKDVYVTGIARNVCVYWTALDMLNYWILPAYKNGNIIKLHFVYDLTRPVAPVPDLDITKEKIEDAVRSLIINMQMNPNIYHEVFEIMDSGMYSGGRRSTRKARKSKNKKAKKTRKNHVHNRNCKKSCRR